MHFIASWGIIKAEMWSCIGNDNEEIGGNEIYTLQYFIHFYLNKPITFTTAHCWFHRQHGVLLKIKCGCKEYVDNFSV